MNQSSISRGTWVSRQTLASVVIGLFLPSAAVSATLTPAALEAAAKKEGAVTYYSAQTAAVNDALVKHFKEKLGITLTIFNAPTTALKIRTQSEIDAGKLQADLVGLGEHMVFDLNEKSGCSWGCN